MQNLLSKSAFARLAGVNPATITRVCMRQFPNAFVGKKIDTNHPEAIAYLTMRDEKQSDSTIAPTPMSEPKPIAKAVQYREPEPAKKVAMGTRNHTEIAKKYANDVISGDILAGKYVILACNRFIDELKIACKDFEFYYDEDAAGRACKFIELMKHTKGEWSHRGECLILQPWQIFFVANIFGWKKKKDHYRRYTEAFLLVPRKNGKSQLAAGIAIYMMVADKEGSPEIYCGATCEKQSNEVFEPCREMIIRNPALKAKFGIDVRVSSIKIGRTGGKLERLIGDPGDGGSPSCAIIDEYHEHKTDKLYSTMETGTMARRQPLLLITTTAGDNLAGPCYAYQLESQKDLDGVTTGIDGRFSLMYGIDAGDDWSSEESLRKANPNFGISVVSDIVMAKLNNAKANPRKQSSYKTKHLNQWVGSMNGFFNVDKWINVGDELIKIEDYYGKEAVVSFDLASKKDIASVCVLIKLENGHYALFTRNYLPEDALEVTASEHYSQWALENRLILTDGSRIDMSEIKDDIIELCTKFQVPEIAFDPFQATMLVTELMKEGLNLVEIGATVKNFSEPMKYFDQLIDTDKIIHNGDPCMTWMMSNVVGKLDAKDNIFPRKERDENKIDGPIAAIMAVNRIMNEDLKQLIDFDDLLVLDR